MPEEGEITIRCILVIFGGTGDLAHRKIYPAIYNLYVSGKLPENFALVAVGRRDFNNEGFREAAAESIKHYSRENKGTPDDIVHVVSSFYYFQIDFTKGEGYGQLKEFLETLDSRYQTMGNRIFYLAVAPEFFETIVTHIAANGMTDQATGFKRVVIEKPFGRDLVTARKLNDVLMSAFSEDQIYRIDHYLGKEMLQNIMVIRFANTMFEPLWNNKYIDHIQITSSETAGVENRGGYYDNAGALRDMLQNHMLQLLMLTAMEPPVSLNTHSIRDEKVKVLKALSPLDKESVSTNVVRGQYGEGIINNRKVPGYRSENRIQPDSDTETFIALKVNIDNFRWAGVPFYLRTGKRLAEKCTKIVVQFLRLPAILYYKDYGNLDPNRLIIEIQPREGVKIKFNGKKPGSKDEIIPVEMDFCQNCEIGAVSPDAYERLLLDVMCGDSTLFTRWDEVEYAWQFVDNISEAWSAQKPAFPNYAAGTWGPPESDELIGRDGRNWVNY